MGSLLGAGRPTTRFPDYFGRLLGAQSLRTRPRTSSRETTMTALSLWPTATASANGNRISQNQICNNAYIGIDLGNDGITAPGDQLGATGPSPNDGQSYPVIYAIQSTSSGWSLSFFVPVPDAGALNGNGVSGTTYTVEFYANNGTNAAGLSEGEEFLDRRQWRGTSLRRSHSPRWRWDAIHHRNRDRLERKHLRILTVPRLASSLPLLGWQQVKIQISILSSLMPSPCRTISCASALARSCDGDSGGCSTADLRCGSF